MPKLSTSTKTDILIHIGIIGAVGLVLFFSFFFLFLPWTTNHGEEIKVPNLKGLTLAETEKVLDARDLNYEISDSTFINGEKPLSVFSQYPKAESGVKKGRKIFLTIITDEPPKVSVPNIINRSENSAKNLLSSIGLLLSTTEYIPAIEKNTVLKMKFEGRELAANEKLAKGSKITLVVGDGYGNTTVPVPNLEGLGYEAAEILIRGSSLNVGSILYDNTSVLPEGSVVRQRPSAGVNIKTGDAVNIWLSGDSGTE
ncbi:MAG: beta-lactam-binding protein with PASTA domain [Arcticibacterium sp.]|jgi:beta-lactam-binding protein with PASTA domain